MKCKDCCNDRYRAMDKTGCATGQDCWYEESERQEIKNIEDAEESKGEIIFSVSQCTQTGMQDVINKVLENDGKIFINGLVLKGFSKCTIFTNWMELVFDETNASIEVPFEFNTNVRVDYIGQDIKIVLEAL